MLEEDKKLTLVGDNGEETVCEILFTHHANGKKYVVFEMLDSEEITAAVYAPQENDESEGTFLDIETDAEWDMLEKLLDQYFEDLEEKA
ncbi:DUF1292 domain-containing protein [Mycoplasmatota bacterium]|nr:DUF1292 domain-containing protein [Mycoplasmatota bacterium]